MDDLPAPGLTSMIRFRGQKPWTSIRELWTNNYNYIRILIFFGCQIGVKGKKWRSNPFGGQNWKKRPWLKKNEKMGSKVDESSKIIYLEYTWIIFELVLSNSVLLSQCTFDLQMIWVKSYDSYDTNQTIYRLAFRNRNAITPYAIILKTMAKVIKRPASRVKFDGS